MLPGCRQSERRKHHAGRDGGEIIASARYSSTAKKAKPHVNRPEINSNCQRIIILTITSTIKFDMQGETREMKSTETWKLSEGGKLLLIESVRPGRDGEEMRPRLLMIRRVVLFPL
jgi:hypothetical protein